jgi:catechol 2,3-dioxygenase-like lactoylglutathione lyase family enzyme
MTLDIVKDSIDLGIIVTDLEASLRFYRDTLGFPEIEGRTLPDGTMRRLLCGTTVIKLISVEPQPPDALPGGVRGATGYRYWTVSVTGIESAVAQCATAGYEVPVPVTELRPAVWMAMIADPDGNWVELLEGG